MARDVQKISIADIILAVDEPLDITECEGEENCHNGKRCLSHDLWSELSEQLHEFLSGIHLGELMQRSGIDQASNGARRSSISRQDGQRVTGPE